MKLIFTAGCEMRLVVLTVKSEEGTPAQCRAFRRHAAHARARLHVHYDVPTLPHVQLCIAGWLADLLPTATIDVYDFGDFKATDAADATTVVCLADVTACATLKLVDQYTQSLREVAPVPIIPPLQLQQLIVNKSEYYRQLAHAGLPVARTMHVAVRDLLTEADAARIAQEIHDEFDGGPIICKPHLGAFSRGVRILHKSATAKRWRTLGAKWRKEGFTDICVQEFVPEFKERFEVRTYWFNGEYAYSIATRSDVQEGKDGALHYSHARMRGEGGRLTDTWLKVRMLAIGKQVQRLFAQLVPPPCGTAYHTFLRIDFGCCLPACASRVLDRCASKIFINEVECAASLFSAELMRSATPVDPAEAFAHAIATTAKSCVAES